MSKGYERPDLAGFRAASKHRARGTGRREMGGKVSTDPTLQQDRSHHAHRFQELGGGTPKAASSDDQQTAFEKYRASMGGPGNWSRTEPAEDPNGNPGLDEVK